MFELEPFKPGDAMIDEAILRLGSPVVEAGEYKPNNYQIYSVGRLIESIVLYERLIVYKEFPRGSEIPRDVNRRSGNQHLPQEILPFCAFTLAETDTQFKENFTRSLNEKQIQEAFEKENPKAHDQAYDLVIYLAVNTVTQWSYAKLCDIPFVPGFDVFNIWETLERVEFPGQTELPYATIGQSILEKTTAAVEATIDDVNALVSKQRFQLDVPLLFNYVLEKATSRKDIISVALDVRDSKEARAFRQQLKLFDEATNIGDDKVLVPLALEMQDKIASLRKKVDEPSVALQVSLPAAIGIDPVGVIKRFQNKRKRHLAFIDQLYNAGIRARSIKLRLGRLL